METKKQSFLHATHLPNLIHIPIKFHKDILNSYWVMEHTRMFTEGWTDGQWYNYFFLFPKWAYKNRFSRWRSSLISDGNDFSYFLSTSHPDDSYQISSWLAFRLRRREIFSRWPPSGVFNLNHFSYFWCTSHPDASKFQVNWPVESGEEVKKRFSRWCHGSHLGFFIKTILAIFDLQVTPMLPTKFWVKWPRV